MGRRLRPFLILGFGLLLGVAILVAFREELVESLASAALRAEGARSPRLTVRDLGWNSAVLVDLRLGGEGEVSARRLRIDYTPAGLLRRRIDRLVLDGLVLQLDLTGDGPPLGSLEPLLGKGEGEGGGVPMTFSSFTLTDARIQARTPLGQAVASLDGEMAVEAGRPSGKLALEALTLRERLLAEGTLSLRSEPDETQITAALQGPEAGYTANLAGALTREASPRLRLDLTIKAAVPAVARALAEKAPPGSGDISLGLRIAGAPAPATEPGILARMQRGTFDARVTISTKSVTYPDWVTDLEVALTADAHAEDGAWSVVLAPDSRLQAGQLDPGRQRRTKLPEWLVAALQGGASLAVLDGEPLALRWSTASEAGGGSLSAVGGAVLNLAPSGAVEARLDGRMAFGPDSGLQSVDVSQVHLTLSDLALPGLRLSAARLDGAITGSPADLVGEVSLDAQAAELALGALRVQNLDLKLPLELRRDEAGLGARLRGSGRVDAKALALGSALASRAPVGAAVTGLELRMGLGPDAAGPLEHVVSLAELELPLAVKRAEGEAAAVQARLGQVELRGRLAADAPYEGDLSLAKARLALPDHAVALEQIAATASLGGADSRVDLSAAKLRDLAEPPRFAALEATGKAWREGELWRAEAEARPPGGQPLLAASGQHRLADGRGSAQIALPPLRFQPGGLQPDSLLPGLSELHGVSGEAEAEAALSWSPKGPKGEARLTLSGVSFATAATTVEELALNLSLDQLFPAGSPPGQRLSVRRIDPGVPLDDLSLSFQVQPGAPPRLLVDDGEVHLTGGRLVLDDALLDPARATQDLVLQVERIDLARLFALLGIAGLSGEGHLSGAVPLAVSEDSLVIRDGQLAATEPGVVRFRSEQAERALAGRGESIELMLRALEDFHYDELSVAINKPAEGNARLTLSLLGKNPAVLEGYPFRFNITVEGQTSRLLQALSEITRLSSGLLRRTWMLRR